MSSPAQRGSDLTTRTTASPPSDNSPAVAPNLQSRGTGKHICPYGANCDRGGVNEDGSMVVFVQNSIFR